MSRNKRQQDDILYITQPTRNILLALGAWPNLNSERSIYLKVHNFFLICISYILLSSDLIPGILYWLMEKTVRVRLQTIPLLYTTLCPLVNTVSLYFATVNSDGA